MEIQNTMTDFRKSVSSQAAQNESLPEESKPINQEIDENEGRMFKIR
jgi:hypothetical protein